MTETSPTPLPSPFTAKSKFARAVASFLPALPRALCKGADQERFFGPHVCGPECDGERGCFEGKSEQGRFARIQAAKSVCRACPEQQRCLDWAVETNQDFGIWGGYTERERAKLRKERKAARERDL